MKIKNLAMKGGGVKGIAYVGALKELDTMGHYETLERVSGTSAGSLVALMVALKLSPDQIHHLMNKLDFNEFKRGCNPLRLFTKYGLYSGDEILDFTQQCFETSSLKLKNGEKLSNKSTFAELKEAKGLDLIAFASNLNTNTIEEFSEFNTPNCIVAEAVRASMSIPVFFKSWRFTNNIPNDHIYVDGGVVYNYPLSFFDKPRFHNKPDKINMETLGLFLEPRGIYEEFNDETPNSSSNETPPKKNSFYAFEKKYTPRAFKYGMLITKFLKHLYETLMHSQDIELYEESHLVLRTVFINDMGIPATKFNLTEKDKHDLIDAGANGVKHYIKFLKTLKNKTETAFD